MGCFGPDTPPPRNYGQETAETLAAQVRLAPDQAAAYSANRPTYTAADLRALNESLLGTGGQRGLMSLYRDVLAPGAAQGANAALSAKASGEQDILTKYGPSYLSAMQGINPQQTALRNQLYGQAAQDLAGGGVSPFEARAYQQAVRAGQADRGLGYGTADAAAEAAYMAQMQNQRRRENQGFAQRVIGLDQQLYGDPFQALIGRSTGAAQFAGGMMGQGQQQGAQSAWTRGLFDPTNAYASDVFNTNYNARAAANIAEANNQASVVGAGLSAL